MADKKAAADETAAPDTAPDAAEPALDLGAFLESELGDEAHKVAQGLIDDVPALLAHLEAQLPMASLGIVHKLLGIDVAQLYSSVI